jgi:hypothetical protein
MSQDHALNLVLPLRQFPLHPCERFDRRSRRLIRRRNEIDERLEERVVCREGKHRIGELQPQPPPRRLTENEELENPRDAHADDETCDGVPEAEGRRVVSFADERVVVVEVLLNRHSTVTGGEEEGLGIAGGVLVEPVGGESEPGSAESNDAVAEEEDLVRKREGSRAERKTDGL